VFLGGRVFANVPSRGRGGGLVAAPSPVTSKAALPIKHLRGPNYVPADDPIGALLAQQARVGPQSAIPS